MKLTLAYINTTSQHQKSLGRECLQTSYLLLRCPVITFLATLLTLTEIVTANLATVLHIATKHVLSTNQITLSMSKYVCNLALEYSYIMLCVVIPVCADAGEKGVGPQWQVVALEE